MLIADAQVHIWAADTPERPWPPIVHPTQSRPHKPQPITKDDMLREMDAAGVGRAVIAPPVWEGVRTLPFTHRAQFASCLANWLVISGIGGNTS